MWVMIPSLDRLVQDLIPVFKEFVQHPRLWGGEALARLPLAVDPRVADKRRLKVLLTLVEREELSAVQYEQAKRAFASAPRTGPGRELADIYRNLADGRLDVTAARDKLKELMFTPRPSLRISAG